MHCNCKGTFTGTPYISWENPWFLIDFPLNRPISTRSRHVEEVHRLRTAAGLPQDDGRGLGEACVLLLRRLDDETGHPFRWLAV